MKSGLVFWFSSKKSKFSRRPTPKSNYSGKRLSEIQTKLCLAWFIARDTVPHTTAHRYKTNFSKAAATPFKSTLGATQSA
ncbi:MAG: hypothetical protein EWV63_15610 [Microcystis aeruginosa Ma_OC_H_19870700_S124]|uniref:Uncharacterized protein n=1 Tax=Microcystis aeruginosa Ma_OC_H_19870700_S124 TaxID=2486262 RepID=A0A552AFU4_MICAE|nr:MAG: hypothetical protein EWV63_15610 [Microcystis aeruginosa Ma_OC_H_19870700_S124]